MGRKPKKETPAPKRRGRPKKTPSVEGSGEAPLPEEAVWFDDPPKKKKRKKSALNNGVIGSMQARYGDMLVRSMAGNPKDDVRHLDGFSWGVTTINLVTTGQPDVGVVDGATYEVYGPFASGKTTLCLTAARECQRTRPLRPVLYVDAEHAVVPRYARQLGVVLEDVIWCQPETAEQAIDMVFDGMEDGVGLAIIDSIAALVPRSIYEATADKFPMAALARLMSVQLPKLAARAKKLKVPLLLINQTRNKMGVIMGNPETTPGGEAPKFTASVRIRVSTSVAKKNLLKGQRALTGDRKVSAVGSISRFNVQKTRYTDPFQETTVPIIFGRGYDWAYDLYSLAHRCGLVTRAKGGGYRFGKKLIEMADLEKNAPLIRQALESVDFANVVFTPVEEDAAPDEGEE